ncbi:MAG: hypothetical protein IJI39_00545, partial [Clostridia bacterium]|nr:hypothetical protein [Clostridia bacterium]
SEKQLGNESAVTQRNSATYDYVRVPVQVGDTDSLTIRFDDAKVYEKAGATAVEYGSKYNKDPLPSYVTISTTGYIEINNAEIKEHYIAGFNLFNKVDDFNTHTGDDETKFEYTTSDPSIVSIDAVVSGINKRTLRAVEKGSAVISVKNTRSGYVSTFTVIVKGEDLETITASKVETGQNFMIAMKADGSVWGWGNNTYGQLGDGSKVMRGYPSAVRYYLANTSLDSYNTEAVFEGDHQAVDISVGLYHTLILDEQGFVYATGRNNYGQLGNGKDYTDQNIVTRVQIEDPADPEKTVDLTGVIDVEAGPYYSLALKADGTVYAWGRNDVGQLGLGMTSEKENLAKPVLKGTSGTSNDYYLSDISSIKAGDTFVVALKNDGNVYAWGSNTYGQLGDGTNLSKSSPVQVLRGDSAEGAVNSPTGNDYLTNVSVIAAGYNHALARTKDGYVWAWGDNQYGQLGNWTYLNNTNNYVPRQVKGANTSTSNTNAKLSNIESVYADTNFSVAITADNKVYAWGRESNDRLGTLADDTNYYLPQDISSLFDSSRTVSYHIGPTNGVVIYLDGYAHAWSKDEYWQYGNMYRKSSTYTATDVVGERPENLLEMFANTEVHTLKDTETLGDGEDYTTNPEKFNTTTTSAKIPYIQSITTDDTIEISEIKLHKMVGFNLEKYDEHNTISDWDKITVESSNTKVATVTKGANTITVTPVDPYTDGGRTGFAVITFTYKESDTAEPVVGMLHVTVRTAWHKDVRKTEPVTAPMVAGGGYFGLALLDNGEVWSWGQNHVGQLGTRTGAGGDDVTYPVKVDLPEDEKFCYIAAGDYQGYAVSLEEGYVYAWGSNANALVGNIKNANGTLNLSASVYTPTRVTTITPTGEEV